MAEKKREEVFDVSDIAWPPVKPEFHGVATAISQKGRPLIAYADLENGAEPGPGDYAIEWVYQDGSKRRVKLELVERNGVTDEEDLL